MSVSFGGEMLRLSFALNLGPERQLSAEVERPAVSFPRQPSETRRHCTASVRQFDATGVSPPTL